MGEKTDLQALNDFIIDIDCLKPLNKFIGEVNFFRVTKINNWEIKHSNFLAWLFDAKGSHKLGDSVILQFLKIVIKNNPNKFGENALKDFSLLDFKNFSVEREKNNLDISIYSPKDCIAITIENKIKANERKKQTIDYRQKVKEKFPDPYNRIFIFLTPLGKEAQDKENWCVATYYDVVEAIEFALKYNTNIKPDVLSIINHYLTFVRRRIIMRNDELLNLLKNIYSKHKQALDLVFDYSTEVNLPIANMTAKNFFINLLKNDKDIITKYGIVFDEDKMCDATIVRFSTHNLEKMIQPNNKSSQFGNGYLLLYELTFNEDWKNLLLELVIGISKGTENKKIDKIYGLSKPLETFPKATGKEKEDEERKLWGRIFYTVIYDKELKYYPIEKIENDFKGYFEKALEIMNDYEEKVMKAWGND